MDVSLAHSHSLAVLAAQRFGCAPGESAIFRAVQKSAVGIVVEIRKLYPGVIRIQGKLPGVIPHLRNLRRRNVIPGNAAIIRADNLGVGLAPAIQFVDEMKIYQRGRFHKWRVDGYGRRRIGIWS